jgi:hypothetical protein
MRALVRGGGMIRITAAAVLTLAFAISLAASLLIWTRYVPGASLWVMFADAEPLVKVGMINCVMLLVPAAILALLAHRAVMGFLVALALAGPALGGLAALNSLTGMRLIEASIGGRVSFAVKAPGYAELLMVLSLGLLVGAVAAGGLLRRRSRPELLPA